MMPSGVVVQYVTCCYVKVSLILIFFFTLDGTILFIHVIRCNGSRKCLLYKYKKIFFRIEKCSEYNLLT
jgi:hypothetical protein